MSDPSPEYLVGVVVAAFNAERWIGETLQSLLDQTCQDWFCVVIDDGSQDGTADVVQGFAAHDDRVRLVQQSNAGLPTARNAGLAVLPQCRHVAFLDADDRYLPHALTTLVQALESRPDAVGAYGLAEYIDGDGAPLHPGLHPARQRWRRELRGRRLVLQAGREDATFRTMAVAGPVWPPAVAVQRAQAVAAVGGFDPSFPMVEDWELYLRLTRLGPYVAVDGQVAEYRRQGTNLSGNHEEMHFHMDRARHLAWSSPQNTPEQRRVLVRAWRLLEARQVLVLGRHALRSAQRHRWVSAGEAAVGVLVSTALVVRSGPPPASRRRPRWTRPDDLLEIPL